MLERLSIAVLAAMLLLAGCGGGDTVAPASNPAPAAPAAKLDIDWFDGDVDAAFAAARAESKPVLLYWGAEWCPPCKQLKASVFSRRDFIEKTRLFVPVYLDGDSEGAQRQGETFGVVGYPTVVILSPERREVLRISGGMDLDQYARMLDLALGDLKPIDTLLAAQAKSTAALPAPDCRRLAWNAWVLEERDTKEAASLSRAITDTRTRCAGAPAAELARLAGIAAYFAGLAEQEAVVAGRPASAWLVERTRAVHDAIADPAIASGVFDVLQWQGDPFYAAARQADFAAPLLARLDALFDRATTTASLDDAEQLGALGAKLAAHRALSEGGEVEDALRDTALRRVDSTLLEVQDPYARAAVVNSVLGIYETLGLRAEARKLVAGEVSLSATPYYYLADLAAIDEELGDKSAALAGYERAWQESRGAATRVQWGAMYLSALLRLAPGDESRIRETGLAVIGEAADPEALYQRTHRRLERLDRELRQWNAGGRHAATIAALRQRMRAGCGHVRAEPAARQRCEAFLAGA